MNNEHTIQPLKNSGSILAAEGLSICPTKVDGISMTACLRWGQGTGYYFLCPKEKYHQHIH